jgi:aspartate aminotransferase
MDIILEDHMRVVDAPANLRINDQIRKYRAECLIHGCERPYHHFAFGQSPFPPPPAVTEALAANAHRHDYLPTAGIPELREAIAAYHRHHFGLHCQAAQVVASPGSKEMIAMALAVLHGPVIIPTPSWVSYLPQAKILKKVVIALRTGAADGFKVTPDALEQSLESIVARQKILILNHPANPTGVVYSRGELEAIAQVCRRLGVVVISDEIYALTAFAADGFTSMGAVCPEGTIVTGGLSKDRSSGGYRLGVGIFPPERPELVANILKIAGATYSCVAAPIQYAALTAYSLDAGVEDYVRGCWRLNAVVGRHMAARFQDMEGIESTVPQGGFYLYLDFNAQGEALRSLGFKTCGEFAEDMLAVEHTALLPGGALLLPEDDFSVRCSFVDYDGTKTLTEWRKNPPAGADEEAAFVTRHCPLIADGVAHMGRYMDQVRAGRRPKHAM